MITTNKTLFPDYTELKERYSALQIAQPKLRIRDAARQLGVAEAQLVALDCGVRNRRLKVSDWAKFVSDLKPLGRVMVLTRNDYCVHERTGHYENISAHGASIGLVTGKDIDLRLFYREWESAFAVETPGHDGSLLRSIQVFDAAGEAIHKVYLKNDNRLPAYEALVAKYQSNDQSRSQSVEPSVEVGIPPAPLSVEDQEAFLGAWSELKDTHDYFVLLKKHKVARLQAMEYAQGRFTRKVGNHASKTMLKLASERKVPIMCFVGNEGAIQIHTGAINKIVEFKDWINVLDPDFNLHLNQSGIATSWVVEKPTVDGTVTSLEVFHEKGGLIVQFFGARKPGVPERDDWKQLTADLR